MKSLIANETRASSAATASALVANAMLPISGAVELQDAEGLFGTHYTTSEEVVCEGESHLIKKIIVELHGTKLDVAPAPSPVQVSKHCPGCHYAEAVPAAPHPVTIVPETTWKTIAQPVIMQRPSMEAAIAQPVAQPVSGFTIENMISGLQPTIVPAQQIQFQAVPQEMQQFTTIPVQVTVPVQALNQLVPQEAIAQQYVIPQGQVFPSQQQGGGAYSQQFVMDRLYSLVNGSRPGDIAFGGRPATLAEYLTTTFTNEDLRKQQEYVIANFDALRTTYVNSIRPYVSNMHELGALVNEAAFYQWLFGMPLTADSRARILSDAKTTELSLLNQAADKFITRPVRSDAPVVADMEEIGIDENEGEYDEDDYFNDDDEVANSEIDSLFV